MLISQIIKKNEFRKSTNDTVDINQDSTDENKVKENEVILDKLTLAKHHVVFKFSFESLAKVKPGRLANK